MSNESPTLNELIQKTVFDYCIANGGGFPAAMVCAVDWIDDEGVATLTVAEFDNQPTHRSLGLTAYLDQWFRDDAQRQWMVAVGDEEED